jgi:hypothetical protein
LVVDLCLLLIENDGKNWVGTRVLPCFTMFYHAFRWTLSSTIANDGKKPSDPASSMLCNKSLGGSLSHWKATNQSRWVQSTQHFFDPTISRWSNCVRIQWLAISDHTVPL